ncbi:hypothetical protein [Endozoicomonas sp. ONNA2]|uniref:hypothetical protein n=1 Tax=Endozoicomonas sp. ONNA2 TaxID=2828741 RepID=UPI0021498B82|nr:hypothetical protein [Endozoicomonas sp. ONNA2]
MKLYDFYVKQKWVRWLFVALLSAAVFVAEGAYTGPGSGGYSGPVQGMVRQPSLLS